MFLFGIGTIQKKNEKKRFYETNHMCEFVRMGTFIGEYIYGMADKTESL